MAYADWPSAVPFRPERDRWGAKRFRDPLETEMEGGNVRIRRRPGDKLATMRWGRGLTAPQMAAFNAFLSAIGDGVQRFFMPVCLDGATYEIRMVQITGGVPEMVSIGAEVMVNLTLLVFPAEMTPAIPVITSVGDQIIGTASSGEVVEIDFGGVVARSVTASAGAFSVDVPFLEDGGWPVRVRYANSGAPGPWSVPVTLPMPNELKATLRAQLLGSVSGVVLDYVVTGGGLILAPAAPASQYLGPATGATVFTRSTSATRVNAQGLLETVAANVPRIDYDPVTLQPRGLRMEGARTNLNPRSGDLFVGAAYTNGVKSISTIPGLLQGAGEFFTTYTPGNTSSAYGAFTSSIALTAGTTYTASGYVILEGSSTISTVFLSAMWTDAVNRFVNIDPIAGTVTGAIAGKIVTKPVYRVGSIAGRDVWRWEVTFTPENSVGANAIQIYRSNAIMDGVTPSMHGWGLQIEAGAHASSYIPTGASAVTRAVDVCYLNTAGWFNPAEGSIFLDFTPEAADAISFSLMRTEANGGLAQGSIYQHTTTSMGMQSYKDGAAQATFNLGASPTARVRIATSFKTGAYRASRNGAAVVGNSAFTMPTLLDRLHLAGRFGGSNTLFGWVHAFKYFPVALTDAQLQALTA